MSRLALRNKRFNNFKKKRKKGAIHIWLQNIKQLQTGLKAILKSHAYTDTCEVKWSEVAQPCQTLCNPVDYSLPGSSLHGILQAKVLEWVAISFSRGSSQPRDWTWVSHIAGRCFNLWATREAPIQIYGID